MCGSQKECCGSILRYGFRIHRILGKISVVTCFISWYFSLLFLQFVLLSVLLEIFSGIFLIFLVQWVLEILPLLFGFLSMENDLLG